MSAPKLVFEWEGRGDLVFRYANDGIEVTDEEADGSSNELNFQEAEHLHAWLEVVLIYHHEEKCRG